MIISLVNVSFSLKDVVRNGKIESTTRQEAASIEYPPVIQTSRTTLLSQQPKEPTDIFSLTRIPSESTCQEMKELCQKGNYVAVDCDIGVFTIDAIDVLLKIHSLRNVKHAVLKEQQWLRKEISLPDSACSYSKEHLAAYANKVFNTPNHYSALSSNRCILASDLATIAGTGWLNFCVITGIAEILNKESEETAALILNNMVLVDEQELPEYVNCNIRDVVKYVVLFANVGKNKRNEVFISKPWHQGNHWTLLYVNLTVNKWYYIDTSCWGMPENLKNAVAPFVTAIYEQGDMAPKPVSGIVPAHIESFGLSHSCCNTCLKNIPVQTCANVCGVAAAVLAGIACVAPYLWRNVFLNRNAEIPTSLEWLLKPTVYSDFLRCSIISWLLTDSINLSILGITKYPVWENKGNTEGVLKEEEKNQAEISENVEESICTGNALGSSSKRAVDGMLNVGNQKQLRETIDEMSMIENTVGDKKLEDDKDNCCLFSENVVIPGDVEVVPIQERRQKDEKNFDHIYLDNDYKSRESVNDGYASVPQCSGGMPLEEGEGYGEDIERNVVMKNDVFFIGQKFHTLEELETAKRVYEDSNFCELWKRDVRTLTAASKRVPKRVSIANPNLTYYSLHLSCKFGGRNVETRVNRKRKTKSFRQGCPFEVHITLSEDEKYLQVNRISTTHNHALQKQIYERLPRQRAARSKEVTNDIVDAIKLQANPKLLQQKIETATGKKVTLKDISNIKQNSKKNIQKNDLEDVIGYLKKQAGCCTDVVVDEENNFKGLFYQDAHMQNIYTHFPEILLVDATYKLLDLRMPVYLLMGIDGDGLSEVVAMFIVAEETKEVIQATVDLFKKHNPSWNETKVVMSDKDFTERDVFKACFPAASLSICLHHTLRSFRREITCEKMGITSAERLRVLEILSSLAHCKSEGEYEKHLDELKQTNFRSVIDYFIENWHPIREQWVACFKDKHLNLGETTNNRLESTFSKFKSVCSRYASLLQFCTEFMSVLRCLREERNHHYVMTIARRQTEFEHLCKDLQEYSKTLTPYAFNFVRGQYGSVAKVEVLSQKSSSEFILCQEPLLASTSHCQCSFFTRMSLPCKHIFKVRELVTLPAFDETLVHKRWTMDFYLTTNRLSPALPVLHDDDLEHCVEYVPVIEEKRTTLTQSQKFKKGLKIAQVLASLVSEGGMSTFKRRHEVLESFARSWKLGRDVIVLEVGHTQTEADQETEDPSETRHENYISVEQVEEDKPTGNADERELGADDKLVNEVSIQNENKEKNLKENSVSTHVDPRKGIKSPDFSQMKMPPKILKRGRPKGAEVTVIGLPKKKKKTESQNKLISFKKLSPIEKDRMILSSLSTSQALGEAIAGKRLLNKEDVLPVGRISDTIRDDETDGGHPSSSKIL